MEVSRVGFIESEAHGFQTEKFWAQNEKLILIILIHYVKKQFEIRYSQVYSESYNV